MLVDNALVEAFGNWPTLLDFPRDRGSAPPARMQTRLGKRVQVETNGTVMRTDVVYDAKPVADGHAVEIGAGDMKTFRQLLRRAAKQFPQFDPAIAEQHARKVSIEDDDELKMGFDFSPQAVFGGIVVAIWLFLILRTGRAFMDRAHLIKMIKEMQAHGGTFRYMTEELPGLKGPKIPLSNKIIVRSVPSTGELIAYVEILGILKVGGVFAKARPPAMALEHIYVHDVLGRRDRSAEFTIDGAAFENQDWKTVGLGPTDAEKLREHFRDALETVFVQHYRERFRAEKAAAADGGGAASP